MRSFLRHGFSTAIVLCGVLLGGLPARGSTVVDEEKGIYIVAPNMTEPAWLRTAAFFDVFMFDMPKELSQPSPQVGLSLYPSLRWSLFDRVELLVGFPMAVNPDGTGDREEKAAERDPTLKDRPYWDSTPDFDMGGLVVGLKGLLWGKPGEDPLLVALGVRAGIPLGGKFENSVLFPRTAPFHTNTMRFDPFVAVAYNLGRFTPQLTLGASIRLQDQYYDPENPPAVGEPLSDGKGYVDVTFSLALPWAMVFEGTVAMLELSGAVGPDRQQLYLTPGVTFLPRRSAFNVGLACAIPLIDSTLRDQEAFRIMVNFSYRLDVLSLSFSKKAGEESHEPTPDSTPTPPTPGER
ncbi:MAG: hypothetical protein GYA21_16470 [Myxococcales bacterium]|nr:hypothetical protein [Myxococcales bacterium]